MKKLTQFMQDVKVGKTRGDYVHHTISDNVVVELSVGPFEYGNIHFRLLVDDARVTESLEIEPGMYYRHLYRIDDEYAEIHSTVEEIIESENETAVSNSHTWEAAPAKKVENYPELPNGFSPETTVMFEDHIQLRDDVSILEALETNRVDE